LAASKPGSLRKQKFGSKPYSNFRGIRDDARDLPASSAPRRAIACACVRLKGQGPAKSAYLRVERDLLGLFRIS